MKRRWKGLCALWMVLALVVSTSPVTVEAEDAVKPTEVSVDLALEEGETLVVEESMTEEDSLEDVPEDTSQEGTSKVESEETTEEETSESVTEEESGEISEENTKLEKTTASAEETTQESEPEETEESGSVEEAFQEEIDGGESIAFPMRTAARAAEQEVWIYTVSDEINVGDYIGAPDDYYPKRVNITLQFDVPFSSQNLDANIAQQQDRNLDGWKLWRCNDSGQVETSLQEVGIDGQISADDYQGFITDESMQLLLIAPVWTFDGVTITIPADGYLLPEGSWQVDNDPTVYSGGQNVFAVQSGSFTFHKSQ